MSPQDHEAPPARQQISSTTILIVGVDIDDRKPLIESCAQHGFAKQALSFPALSDVPITQFADHETIVLLLPDAHADQSQITELLHDVSILLVSGKSADRQKLLYQTGGPVSGALIWPDDHQMLAPRLVIAKNAIDTQRHRREERRALIAEINRFRDFAEAGVDLLWELDTSFVFTRFFRTDTSKHFSSSPIGKSFVKLLEEQLDYIQLRSVFHTLEQHLPVRDLVIPWIDSDGPPRYVRISAKPIFSVNNQFLGYRGTGTDVSAEYDARQQALSAQIRLNDAVESMPAAFLLFDRNHKLVLWNTKSLDVFPNAKYKLFGGVSYQALFKSAVEKQDIIIETPEEQHHILENESDMHIQKNPVEWQTSDQKWFRMIRHSSQDDGTVCVIADITEIKINEAAARHAQLEAETANHAKTKFLASASHDLRQPLHAIGLLLNSLAYRVDDPDANHLINRMEQALESLQGMFNTLLDISRLDANMFEPEIKVCRLSAIFDELRNEFSTIAKEKNLQLRIRPTQDYVISDHMLLDRILRNLVSNALRYTADGGIIVGTRRRLSDQHQPQLVVEVWDSGIGMDADDLGKIFKEFKRLGPPVKDSRLGLGLGLSIVDRLSKLLGHQINVRSEKGKGSVFSITLPLAEDVTESPSVELEDMSAYQNTPLLGEMAIILDDDAMALEGMQHLLRGWGCEVIASQDLESLLTMIKQERLEPDLLLLDFALAPDLTGIQAHQDICQLLGYTPPSLIITASTDEKSLKTLNECPLPFLTKPVNHANLMTQIQKLLTK